MKITTETTQVDSIRKHYEAGQPIFEELFKLSDKELKEKLKEICYDSDTILEILNSGDCIRTIKNETPDKAEFWFYDGIEVSWYGIVYIPEHSERKVFRKFDHNFKI